MNKEELFVGDLVQCRSKDLNDNGKPRLIANFYVMGFVDNKIRVGSSHSTDVEPWQVLRIVIPSAQRLLDKKQRA